MKLLVATVTVTLVCLCDVVLGQTYYEEYQPQNQNRPAPARLSPVTGPVHSVNTKPTPVPILKQINKHNEDGSYTYGFEGADGSFKIETKAQTGEVKGKYGYVDETGKVRVVEYGADKNGFQPSGEGITVAPPTLVDGTRLNGQLEYQDEEDRQPQGHHIARVPNSNAVPRPLRPAPKRVIQPQYEEHLANQYDRQQFNSLPAAGRSTDVTYSTNQRAARPAAAQEYIEPRNTFAPPAQPKPQYYEQHQLSPGYDIQQPAAPRLSQPQQVQYSPGIVAPPSGHIPQQTKTISRPQGRASILDQLAKDYALPSNGAAPLTDISFGFY